MCRSTDEKIIQIGIFFGIGNALFPVPLRKRALLPDPTEGTAVFAGLLKTQQGFEAIKCCHWLLVSFFLRKPFTLLN